MRGLLTPLTNTRAASQKELDRGGGESIGQERMEVTYERGKRFSLGKRICVRRLGPLPFVWET